MNTQSLRAARNNSLFRRKVLALAIASAALGFAAAAYAQAVNGTIHGAVPVAPNEAIQITGGAGFNRTITVGPSGRYSITLPVGTYSVSLLQDGKVIQTRAGVSPTAAGAVSVNFSASAGTQATTTLSAINVTAASIPPIDVTNTRQVTTITSQQLQQLPLARDAAAIALLAPGVQPASGNVYGGALGTPMVDFGGATTAENAYYVDGMNTTYQLVNQGGLTLPYGAIAEQQTFISGYGAKYGRSIGGVINQIGKSGSNQWHFGVRALYSPASWTNRSRNTYWANPLNTQPGQQPGDLLVNNRADQSSGHTYDAYVSGPIIKDHLFFYLGIEKANDNGRSVGSVQGKTMTYFKSHDPKTYLKLNWNINSSNFLTLTAFQDQMKAWDWTYNYDYKNFQTTTFRSIPPSSKTSFLDWVANYTSYITDNLTLHAMFGKQHGEYYQVTPAYPGFDPNVAPLLGAASQNPAFTPNGPVFSPNSTSLQLFNNHQSRVMNYRVNLDYKWHNHNFEFGIDNVNIWDNNDGSLHSGPGYAWLYGHTDPSLPIIPGDPSVPPYVGPPDAVPGGASGYWVAKQYVLNVASVFSAQRAQYIEDRWQITPRLLLDLGLRDDEFTNYNAAGLPYIRLTKPQWSPRLGFSWDVHGDSTLKVFGNAGRYYLAMPSKSALWVGTKVALVNTYGTYTGVNQTTGAPIGYQPNIPQNPATGVSPFNEYGTAVTDPRLVTAQNIKAEYSDNFVLGVKQEFKMLDTSFVAGATATYQTLGRIIDRYGDTQRECDAGRAQGLAFLTPQACGNFTQSILLINPGEDATVTVMGPDGKLHSFNFSEAAQGFVNRPKRNYYALDLSLEHAWDGKWFGRLDYVVSRQYGNEEGPVSAAHNQAGSYDSVNAAWEFPEFSVWNTGDLPSDRRQALKAYGAVALSPEWTVGGNVTILSGLPKMCVGAFGPEQETLHGFGSYHWCAGQPSPPGSQGRYPWTKQVDLNVTYSPAWAGHKLDFQLAVFNVFNDQAVTSTYQYFGSTKVPNPFYNYVQSYQPPRYARFSVSYNF
ncbi:MAG TPA: Oar protein [Rhodanobacteraceae bacterium]